MAEVPKPSGTIAFLFTDIEGSTKRWQSHGAVMGQAVTRHDALMRQAIATYAGHVFKTIGDAFCIAFESTGEALAAAIAAQHALAAEPWVGVDPIRVRMAIHVGTTEERDGDYFGPPVNRAARLLSAGYGGQLLLSRAAAELVHDSLPAGIGLRDLGEHRLKDLDRAEHIFQAVIPDLPSEFGPLHTVDARPNNLPLELTPFVGRVHELGRVREVLQQPEVRLLTLIGPGGIGKTRLALQVVADSIDAFPDGAFFVSLAAITDPDLVVPAIADALVVREVAGQPLQLTVRDHLRGSTIVLVLDNFEHVAAAAPVVPTLLRECPKLKIVVTSRSVLRVSGEHEFAVPGLDLLPAKHDVSVTAAEALSTDAVNLFAARARTVKADFAVTDDNANAVSEICRRLDGLPLAIELAAARVRMLSPQAMLPRLESRLKLLTGGARDLPDRQQTLRGAIAWSYDLLPEGQQTLLARMSVFARGATLEAAEAICAGFAATSDADAFVPPAIDVPDVDVFEGIAALVDQSLLRQDDVTGETRFTMLETIREFGLERLVEAGQADELHRRHALHFFAFAEQTGQELTGANQAQSVRRFDAEHDNLRAAMNWALEAGHVEFALRLGRALAGYWQLRGFLSEGRSWLERALAQSGEADRTLRARVLNNVGALAAGLCDFDRAQSAYEESLAVWREVDDRRATAVVLTNLGQVARNQGEYIRAQDLHTESLSIVQSLQDHDRRMLALPLHNLGVVAHDQGDFGAARTYYYEALEAHRTAGDIGGIAHATRSLARVHHHLGEPPTSHELFQSAIRQFRAIGDRAGLAQSLTGFAETRREAGNRFEAYIALIEALTIWKEIGPQRSVTTLEEVARLALEVQRFELAARMFGAADALRQLSGEPLPPTITDKRRRLLDHLNTILGPEDFARAWKAGSALDAKVAITESIAEALSETESMRAQPG